VFVSTSGMDIDKKKPTIMLIHGSGLSHIVWSLHEQFYTSQGFNVLSVYIPGHGNSEGPSLKSIQEISDWIKSLMIKINIEKIIILGHSQGGLVCIDFASRYPELTDKIVLVKNPVNPDLSLWLGGIERLYSSNIKNLGVIHRGFSTYEKTKFRNNPEWQLPIELQNKYPDLPLICDPSHICGKRDTLHTVSQTALDLNFDGLMIETHTDPDQAWSDAAQQIKPSVLTKMMSNLKMRKTTDDEIDFKNTLNTLRTQIDIIDQGLLDTLGKRMKVAIEIGDLKKKKNVAVLQTKRWNEILGKMILEGEGKGLSEEFILRMFKAIHQESINHQNKVINS